jgi:ferredoxin-like protein FixX
VMILDEWLREQPKLCSDRKTMGYDSWTSLRAAVRDINRYSAHRFDRWHDYFAAIEEMMASPKLYPNGARLNPASFADDRMYYEERIVLTICPGAVLKPSRRHSIFINTESVMIECEGCQVVGGSTHLSFGPAAQNTVIRGILFKMAGSSSLLFYHDGAEVSFEDCTWIVRENRKTSSLGAIAEVNSTSLISFSRCVASESDGRLTEMTTSLRNA